MSPLMVLAVLNGGVAAKEMEEKIGFLDRQIKELPDRLFSLGVRVVMAMVIFAVGVRVIVLVRRLVKRTLTRSNASTEAVQFLDSALKSLLYVILVFMILQLFGVEAASIATVIGDRKSVV